MNVGLQLHDIKREKGVCFEWLDKTADWSRRILHNCNI
jgi:hypothetical protein